MPIHERLYARLSAPPSGATAIPAWAIAHYGSRYAMRGWFPRLVFFAAFAPCLLFAFLIYLSSADPTAEQAFRQVASHVTGAQLLTSELSPEAWRELARYGAYSLLKIQTGFILLLNAFVGARLVADDVRSRAFEVYMTRPLRALDYALGKLLVVLRPQLLITVIPLGVVFLAGSVLWEGFFAASWPVLIPALLGALMLSVVNGVVILGISSMTRSARYATVMWFALYFFTMVVHGILFAVTQGTSARFDIVSYSANQHILLQKMLGLRGQHVLNDALAVDYPVLPSALIIGALAVLAAWLVLRRCRPGELRVSPEIQDPATVIEARSLARWYGPVIGLTDVTVDVPAGIVGLLGPNGAGKSTLMRLLTGQILPSRGTVSVLGRNPVSDPDLYRDLGFVSEDDSLFESWTAMEFVTFLAKLSGYGGVEARERSERALERCGIAHAAHRRVGGYSKGMRQRTRLAGALVHDPRLLLLDEPMTGLDPVGRRAVVDLIEGLADEGRSVIFASHILHEVEAVARYVVVMSRGMVLAEGSVAHIQESLSDYAFTMEITCSEPRRLAADLVAHPHVVSVGFIGSDTLRVATDSARQLVGELPGLVLDLDVEVSRMTCPEENLETLFKKLVS